MQTIGERWRQGADLGGGEVGGATAQFWVLLDAEGTVVDRRHGDLLPEHLDAWLTGSAR